VLFTRQTFIAGILATIAGSHASAQPQNQGHQKVGRAEPPLIPLSALFSAPEAVDDVISPDGTMLAWLAPWRGRLNIHVGDAKGRTRRRVTADSVRSITSFWWSADGKRLLYLQDRGGNEQYHLFVRTVRGTESARDLTPFSGVEVELVSLPSEAPSIAVVTLNQRDPRLADAYRLNLMTGTLELAAQNPGSFLGYVADARGTVRVAYSLDSLGRYALHERAQERDPWRIVRRYAVEDRIAPLRLHADGTRLYMVSNADVDLSRLVLVDLHSGTESVVHADPLSLADIETPIFDGSRDALLVTAFQVDTLRAYPHTEPARNALSMVRSRAGAGTYLPTSVSRDASTWVFAHTAAHRPMRTWLVHLPSATVRLLHRVRPALDNYPMARTRPISLPARDGLTLHGYVTEPLGRSGKRVPLVVLVHGGPWSRDVWEYQSDVQMLANRGYAVLQVNFRGSVGFGKTFARAARHEFAGRMQSDLLDGVQWTVTAGIADPKRIAIMGGSYGGYAALVGLTFTPREFACAVDYAGPSNLITLMEAFPPSWQPFLPRNWYPFVGDPRDSASRADLARRSPLFRADSAVAPLLIFQGANDPRVTTAQSNQMAVALHRRGIAVTYLLAGAEGHSFGEAETALAVHRATEEFLGKCLGGRVQGHVPAAVTRAMRGLHVDVAKLARP
jgi:dipeptidyl aminopeptidase/acylaminoacyl peptidase